MQTYQNAKTGSPKLTWKRAAITAVVLVPLLWWGLRTKAVIATSSFTVRRGNLPITIVQAGSIEALETQELRSEVKGYQGTKILTIVEEGSQVTDEDVKNGKVLVELDSSDIKQRLATQDIEYQTRISTRTEAQQGYEIQLNQGKADIKAAEQKVRFALLDLEKFVGTVVAKDVIAKMGITEWKHAVENTSNGVDTPEPLTPVGKPTSPETVLAPPTDGTQVVLQLPPTASVSPPPATPPPMAPVPAPPAEIAVAFQENGDLANLAPIDYSQYAKVELLGDGEAQQKLREAKDGLLLAEKEKSANQEKLTGTERLYQKGFVTRTEFETAKLEFDQEELKVQKAATAYDLFLKYDFPKSAEEFVSKYEEAVRVLERTRKEAVSKLAQARAKMTSAEGQYKIVFEQRKDLLEQLDKCVLRAKKAGLVIYGGTGDSGYYYNEERIREGALVRERQPIISIPDMNSMSVKVKIHESHIKKVKMGMKARVRVDAFPDKVLDGEVMKVGVLPDSQTRWMSADMKVYLTTIKIAGTYDWLKPGMSGKVEILASELKDVLFVPIQAVVPEDGQRVCYVLKAARSERQMVSIGQDNDEFIEILSGVKEGDKVLLRIPDGVRSRDKTGNESKTPTPEAAPAAPKTPGTSA